MRKIFGLALGFVLAAGCAATTHPVKTGEKTGAKTVIVCEWEQPTGSNIAQQVCRRQDEMDAEKEGAQEFLRKPLITKVKDQ